MSWPLVLLLLLGYTALPSSACYGNGCGGRYNFRACNEPICHNGKYIGYGCRHGICPFVCFGTGCQNARFSYNHMNPMMLRNSGFYGGWGRNAYGYRGCMGGNCGFWNGCANGHCSGFYDFRRCATPSCVSGPYHGHACRQGTCRYICFQGVCHTPYAYGLGCVGHGCDSFYQYPQLECQGMNCFGQGFPCYGPDCENSTRQEERDDDNDDNANSEEQKEESS